MTPDWSWLPWSELGRDALHDVLRLRAEIFVVEQECAYQDIDGLDPQAHHLLGTQAGELIAYLRAFAPGTTHADCTIGRVVVAGSARGTGLGRRLMREGQLRAVQTWGPTAIRVGAQAHLEQFYGSLGYRICGPGYDEDGIPHLPMRRP